MDIEKLKDEAYNDLGLFTSTPKDKVELVIFDFLKPIKKEKYNNCFYVYYDCMFLNLNGNKMPVGNHIVQLPHKTAWLQLYEFLKFKNKLNEKEIHLKINKKNNFHYTFNII